MKMQRHGGVLAKGLLSGKGLLPGKRRLHALVQQVSADRAVCEALERRQLLSAGDPDLSFGTNGATLLSVPGQATTVGYSVTVDNQGRTIVAGDTIVNGATSLIAVARYLPDGTLDTTFGSGGRVTISAGFQDQAWNVTTDSLGRVIVVGDTTAGYDPSYHTADFLVARLNTDGSLDTSFNGTGEAIIDFAGGADEAYKALVEPDGKILVCGVGAPSLNGSAEVAIAQLNTDGTLDAGFGSAGTGKVLTNVSGGTSAAAASMSLDSLGRIVVVGYATQSNRETLVMRYNSDGTLDSSFGNGGVVITPVTNNVNIAEGVDFTASGQIVVGGESETFNTSTLSIPNGYDISVEQYNTDGSLDSSFGNGGVETIDYASKNQYVSSVRVLSGEDIELAGYDVSSAGDYETMDVRLLPSGGLDDSYNGTGRAAVVLGQFLSSTIAADGTISETGVPGNNGSSIAVARITSSGAADSTFGNQGLVTTNFTGPLGSTEQAAALQADGKFVIAGYAAQNTGNVFAVARVNPDGSPDATFGTNGVTTISFNGIDDRATGVAIQPDGDIVVVGFTNSGTSSAPNYDFAIVRLNPDGTIDTSFGTNGKVVIDQLLDYPYYQKTQDYAESVAVTPDGHIIVAGFTSQNLNGFNVMAIARLTPAGALDTSLNGDGRADASTGSYSSVAYSVAVDSSGRVVLGGYGAPTSGASGFMLARLTAAGAMDTTFGTSGYTFSALGGNSSILRSLAIQADGRIDAGGNASVSGYQGFAVARYTANGALDPSFNSSGYALMNISSAGVGGVVPLSDGGFLAGGGNGQITVAKFTSSGTLDGSFGTGGIAASNFGFFGISALAGAPVIAVRPSGAIVVAGTASEQKGSGFVAFAAQFQGSVAPATASITGNVYLDANGNGVQDPGEPAAFGATVYLDLNGDATLDSNDPRAVTTATGEFSFTGLAPGQYTIREIVPFSDYATTPAAVTVTASSAAPQSVSFGVAYLSTLTGEVYNDSLGYGFATNNAGLPGVTVYLDLNGDGVFDSGDPYAVSDSNGNYSIANCPAGTYTLREVVPSGDVITQPQFSDAPGYYTVYLGAGPTNPEPFGDFRQDTASGTVFNDLNGDGVQDGNEPGLAGWTVFADLNGTGVLASNDPTAITNASGQYSISNLGPGTISLYAIPQPGYTVPANSSSMRLTSGDNVSFSFPVTSTYGSIAGIEYVDSTGYGQIANEQPGSSVMTEVYIDTNNNGQLDPGEPAAYFNSGGGVTFTNVSAGTYTIRQALAGTQWVQTIPAASAGVTVTVTAGQTTSFSFADFHLRSVLGTYNTSAATGTGLVPAGTALTVSLNSPSGIITTQTATTSSTGNYQVNNLGPGTVTVTPSVLAGYTVTPTSATAASLSGAATTLNFTAVASGVVGGSVFSDDNDNGVQDSGEASLSGVEMFLDVLAAPGGSLIQTLSTLTASGTGSYSFTSLPPGDYVVRQQLPAAYARETVPTTGSYALSPFTGGTSANNNFGDLPFIPNKALTGTIIGTSGSYDNDGNTIAKAFDGNFSTFFDAPTASGSWVGLDLGSPKIITQVSFASRSGFASRMNGGTFQASNSSTFGSGDVTLYVIGSAANPSSTSLTNEPVNVSTPYRYVRYVGPANSYCDVSELDFFGIPPAPGQVTGINFNSSASPPTLTFSFSEPLLQDPGIAAIHLQNVTSSTASTVPSTDLAESYNASASTITVTFPGFTSGKPPAGIYSATLNSADVSDINDEQLSNDPTDTFLFVPTGSRLTLPTGRGTVTLQQFSIQTGAVVDLTNNSLILSGGGSAGYSMLLPLIQSGYKNGTWQGSSGIVSGTAASDSKHLTALGLVLSTGQTFEHLQTQVGDVLLMYTYYGDANLDGKVDASDYSLIDNGFLNHLTGWANGDFNYDGVVNGSDYTLIDNAFNQQGASLSSQIASPNAGTTPEVATPSAARMDSPMACNVRSGLATALGRKVSQAHTNSYVPSVFSTATPLAFAGSSQQNIELSLQQKDRLDDLFA